MKIGVAQTRPVKGDVLQNIEAHVRLIELAARAQAKMMVFPELSLTGYEPRLAGALATTVEDVRLDVFQLLSDRYAMTIGVGIPTRAATGVLITELFFRPGEPRQAYSKRYLHTDEEPYFVRGTEELLLEGGKVAPAICYELSVPEHSEKAHRCGAEVYLVSVAKTESGMEKAVETLSDIAKRYSMTVLVSNAVGFCDNFDCSGGSAVWSRDGVLLAKLGATEEAILVLDTETGEVSRRYIWGGNCDGWHLLESDSLSVIQERIPPGGGEVMHYHDRAQQLFYILAGVATFDTEGMATVVREGGAYHVRPGTMHRIRNLGLANLDFLVVSEPRSHGDRVNV